MWNAKNYLYGNWPYSSELRPTVPPNYRLSHVPPTGKAALLPQQWLCAHRHHHHLRPHTYQKTLTSKMAAGPRGWVGAEAGG